MFKGAEQLTSKRNGDGTYTMESLHLVNVSRQESERVLTCKVQHEAQPPIQAKLILSTAAHGTYKPIGSSGKLTSTALSYWVTLSPEWSEVFKLTEPHLLSPSVHWYLGPEMPVLLFVAFLLGFKVLLVMSFIVTYICRRQNL